MKVKALAKSTYPREVFASRLNEVLKASGLQEELDREGKSITLYSFRHQYACWRLRYGDVPIHLLAKQMGTSIQKIEQTYGHIEVEQQADLITKAQDHIKKTGFVLNKPEVIEEDDINYITEKVVTNKSTLVIICSIGSFCSVTVTISKDEYLAYAVPL